ncbi:hypothetical protein NEMBOFW57_005773 [Staphylotrichum longicolle]|uniref:CFEM domain-containing protein n=1 Tax=Staphylotrichum longicolle TaxID=669026 RepID=A0AAD4F0W1_9PEZI|nr:hypothetical protein NEMBOFW57_005773 [Staphylotrichum longicolle]
MKYTAALVALAAATVSAQDISVFPECSLPCIITAVGTTSCAATDFACVCKNMEAVKTAATPCVVDKCGLDKALNEVLPATEKFCADVGTGGGAGSSSSSSSGPDAPTATVTTSAAPEPTGGDDGEDDGDDDDNETPSATGSSIGSIITQAPSGSSIPSAKPPKPTSSVHTAGAPAAAVVGGWAAVLLGAVAAL